jgi:hypothetical protein
MKEDDIVMIVMASIFAVAGISLIASQRLTDLALRTRRGQKWVRWFGEKRASIILRFVVGPFVLLMAAGAAWVVMTAK